MNAPLVLKRSNLFMRVWYRTGHHVVAWFFFPWYVRVTYAVTRNTVVQGESGRGHISDRLTFLANDRGYDIVSSSGPYPDGSTEYVMVRRALLNSRGKILRRLRP